MILETTGRSLFSFHKRFRQRLKDAAVAWETGISVKTPRGDQRITWSVAWRKRKSVRK